MSLRSCFFVVMGLVVVGCTGDEFATPGVTPMDAGGGGQSAGGQGGQGGQSAAGGQAGSGQAGSGQAGSGQAGGGQGGGQTAGGGQAGNAQAGSGGQMAGQAGESGQGGEAGQGGGGQGGASGGAPSGGQAGQSGGAGNAGQGGGPGACLVPSDCAGGECFVVDCVGGVCQSTLTPGQLCSKNSYCNAQGECVPSEDSPSGCADGQREGLTSTAKYPKIAACQGAWTVPGVSPDASTCDHQSGDDLKVDGAGCSAADLCAVGWHVCVSADEVASRVGGLPVAQVCVDATDGPFDKVFYGTAQSGPGNNECGTGNNDIFGCGKGEPYKLPTDKQMGCVPFNAVLANKETTPEVWQFVNGDTQDEAKHVTKTPGAGGVLCCLN